MQMLTNKNHYNPCFWTAHWNPDYFRAVKQGLRRSPAREAAVYALSVKANKVFKTKCKDVHYDKHLGVAEVTVEAALDFCRRRHPEKYGQFVEDMKQHDYAVYIDFEDLFRGMEDLLPYQTLLKVIRTNTIAGAADKAHLAHFVVWQTLRSHAVMNAMLELRGMAGTHKFESLLELKWALSNPRQVAEMILPLSMAHWTLYHADADTFPLSDSAISMKAGRILATLSPRHLLEVDLSRQEAGCWHRNRIAPEKLAEFRRRTVGNTFREIIFSDRAVLEEWRSDPCFQDRVRLIGDMKSYNALVEANDASELWKINAYGNM